MSVTTGAWTAIARIGRLAAAAAVAILVAGGPSAAADREATAPAGPIALPMTFEKIWFREENRKGLGKLKAFKHGGLLTVTEDGLDFVGKKNSYFFPLEDIEMISIGLMQGDVNTEWVALSIREAGATRVIGLRDGHAWGYGEETWEIYRNLRQTLEQLQAGPYTNAPGFETYDRLADQVILDYPEGWSAFVVRAIYVGSGVAYGRVVFSPRDVESVGNELKEQRALPSVDLGNDLAIVFDRDEAARGMNCDELDAPARASILEGVRALPVFAEAAEVLAAPVAVDARVAGCQGLRIQGRARGADGRERAVDLRVFAHHDTLFTLGFRVPADLEGRAVETLEAMVGSILLPLAWPE